MIRFSISTQARRDLHSIHDQSRAGWGDEHALALATSFADLFERLATAPGIGRPRPELGDDVRSVLRRPFIVIYRYGDQRVTIIRVLNGRRDLKSAISEFELE